MQYALVSSTCNTTRRNMTLAVERNVKQQINIDVLVIRLVSDLHIMFLVFEKHKNLE